MAWVKLDDRFPDHPKPVSVGPLGMAMQVAALCYCNTHLTDGFIQFNAVRKLLSWEFSPPGEDVVYTIGITSGMSGQDVDWQLIAGWLVDAGMWEMVEGGYKIHDYLDYQPSRDEVLEERSKAQERMKRVRSDNVRPNFTRTSEDVREKFNDPVPGPDPVPQDNQLGNGGVFGGEESPRPPALPRLKTNEIDYENLTPLQAMELPEMQIYRDATGMLPGRPLYRLVTETIQAHKFTADKLRPFWVEWNARGFRVNNLAWLTEWACAGAIPEKIRPAPNGSGKKSTREQLLEA